MSEGPVSVVGLGLMGTAITERLLSDGYRVCVWNRTREKSGPLLERGATWSDDPFSESDRVVLSLYSSEVVAEVIEKAAPSLRAGQYVIDTTTGLPAETVSLGQRLRERGVHYLDAPISGSSEQTRRREATVMVGGHKEDFDACSDLWAVFGKSVFYTGPSGSASTMKLVTNLVLGLNRAVLAEGLAFAGFAGVDAAAALEILKASPAYSRAMDVKGMKMVNRDFSVQAKLAQHLKDVKLMLHVAMAASRSLPLSTTHCELLERGVAAGLGDLDNSAIIEVLSGTRAP